MVAILHISSENQLLRRLSADDRAALGPFERIELTLRQDLERPNEPIEHVYFVDTGFASVVADRSDDDPIEIGLIGNEGMTGVSIVLGDTQSPFATFVQGNGIATRISAANLRQALLHRPGVRKAFGAYVRYFLTQTACTAASNGRSTIETRLARWLVMVADRMGNDFSITHDFLAIMLAVRRSGVTVALQQLEGDGLIRSTRGNILILDRSGLLAVAGDSYGVPEREYRRLFGLDGPPTLALDGTVLLPA